MQDFTREWALSWVRGSIVGYVRGSTPLNIVLGRIKRALESYGVTVNDIELIVKSIEADPSALPHMDLPAKKAKLNELREALKGMRGSNRGPVSGGGYGRL
ncbi:hypothetical protein IG193_09025 [Infirmifilum lucidum]|uniref:Uncharacterized protein n=1 Tax=Infirmifilum lucidum TaxID=2776706 RepID=A0A7L9FGI3_9CREN|nr:hypothetical protein [Infirmifilum lucidum]QOJ78869.1 hypothetical protein IG193_09025 [Infirmifilum lucidum]